MDSNLFFILLNQGSSNGALGPSPLGATSRGLYTMALLWYCKAKQSFILMSRGHKFWESLEGGHKPWNVESNCSKPSSTDFANAVVSEPSKKRC